MTTPSKLITSISSSFPSLKLLDTWGEKSFFYDPENVYPRGTYFCTIKEKDGDNDKASQLDREGIFRLNFGLSKNEFSDLFKEIPKRPTKGNVIQGDYDFTEKNILTPHPIYGWMSWVAIISPTEEKILELMPLLHKSYTLVKKKHAKKQGRK